MLRKWLPEMDEVVIALQEKIDKEIQSFFGDDFKKSVVQVQK